MIISQEREEDRIAVNDLASIIEIAGKQYEKSKDPQLERYIKELFTEYEALRKRVETGDYTEADERRNRVDAILKLHSRGCV